MSFVTFVKKLLKVRNSDITVTSHAEREVMREQTHEAQKDAEQVEREARELENIKREFKDEIRAILNEGGFG